MMSGFQIIMLFAFAALFSGMGFFVGYFVGSYDRECRRNPDKPRYWL